MKKLLFCLAALVLSAVVLFPSGLVFAARVSSGMAYMPGVPVILPTSPPEGDKHSPLGTFVMNVPWRSQAVTCDGYVDPATEWSDAAYYDISDTSGQSDGIKDPVGTVSLYVKQDSLGVWFAVINHADTYLENYDQIGLYIDDDHDGCFPATATNEGNIWVYYEMASGMAKAQWRCLQDTNCTASAYDCMIDFVCTTINITLPYCAMGTTNGQVSWEVMVPYGAADQEINVPSPVGMDVGFFVFAYNDGPGQFNSEWPSQNRESTWKEPCYYGNLICEGPDTWYFKPGYPDYAPSGMPDFDQKQDSWDNPPGSDNWSHCGPVAVANCLWWFDSKYQWLINPGSPPPPAVNDDFPLIGVFGTGDDHIPGRFESLVHYSRWVMDTDGIMTGVPGKKGTNVFEMESGVVRWLLETNTDSLLWEHTRKTPDFYWIENEIKRSQDVILLLGFWQYFGLNEWRRVGGHFVTCAGVNSEKLTLAISDPFYDMAEMGMPGRVLDGSLILHPNGVHDTWVHNDAGNISHDYYTVLFDQQSPGGPWSMPDYPPDDSVVTCTQFFNCPTEYQYLQTSYNNQLPVHTEIEYAVAISPVDSTWHLKGQYPDYAPDGMPDFDQNQHDWSALCGPAAVANCLWWFDSKYQWLIEPSAPPPYEHDSFNLVTSYIHPYDDHDWQKDGLGYDNVQYLIEHLAGFLGTDSLAGTDIDLMQNGIRTWIMDRGLNDVFYEHTLIDSLKSPEFFFIIENEIKRCQDVILLLGFWQEFAPEYWKRVGGHYATCAGVNSDSLMILISDPDFDQHPISWPYADAKWHNNAALVSHDRYMVAPLSASPGGYWWIPGYPQEVGLRHAFQNCPKHLVQYQATPEPGLPIHTEIEGAVMVSPIVAPPEAVQDLKIYTAFRTSAPLAKDIRLVWSPVTSDVLGNPMPPDYYVVYRDTVPSFAPDPAKELVYTTDTTYLDVDAAGDMTVNYYYYVNARKGLTWESANSDCVGEVDREANNHPK